VPPIVSNFIEVHVYAPRTRKFLLLKRAPNKSLHPGIWQMITGKVRKNETTKAAVLRELREETGLRCSKLFVVPRINCYYMEPLDVISLSPVFLAEVENTDVKLSKEHEDYKWVNYKDAVKLVHWEDQKESIRAIKKYLRKISHKDIKTHSKKSKIKNQE
jgi:8-oxo-dGTP pyrophosphatase MutT (NUDIX family)